MCEIREPQRPETLRACTGVALPLLRVWYDPLETTNVCLYLPLTPLSANLLTSLRVLPHFPASSKKVVFENCFVLSLLLAP